jgi:hypothetical protein
VGIPKYDDNTARGRGRSAQDAPAVGFGRKVIAPSVPIRWAEMNCRLLFQNCMFYISRNDRYVIGASSSL